MSPRYLMIFLAAALSLPVQAEDEFVTSRGDYSVNIRSTPNGPVVGRLSDSTSVKVIHKLNGGWWQVEYQGQTGYVFNSLVRPTTEARSLPGARAGTELTVNAEDGAYIRSGPSKNSSVIGTVPDDEVLTVGNNQGSKPVGDWWPVTWEGKSGFIHRSAVVEEENEASAACVYCTLGQHRLRKSKIGEAILDKAREHEGPATTLESRWSLLAWKAAIAGRVLAHFYGGRPGRKGYGNKSKGECAAAVQDVLVAAGLCTSRPGAADAISLFRRGLIASHCPGLQLSQNRNPYTAPVSLIVYSGYAGRFPHTFGHTEAKVLVTPGVKAAIRSDVRVGHVQVGQYIYCSDFCNSKPTMTAHNPVAAIYTLK